MADPTSKRLLGYESITLFSIATGTDLGRPTALPYATVASRAAFNQLFVKTEDPENEGEFLDPVITDYALAINAYDGTLNLQGDQIEVTVKGDHPFRSYGAGFKDATINISLRNDPSGADVKFFRTRLMDSKEFGLWFIDNWRAPTDGSIWLPCIITTGNTAGDFQSSQDLTFELKPAITTDLQPFYTGTWGESD
jgi:hypothetical protein